MNRGNILLENKERFTDGYRIPRDKLEKAIDVVLNKLSDKAELYKDKFPSADTKSVRYELGENDNWVHGMQSGLYILAYEITGDKKFLEVPEAHLDSYKKRIDEFKTLNDHDVGFVFSPSCVALHRVTGNEYAKELSLRAVDILYNFSYTEKGGFILRSGIAKDTDDMQWIYWCRTMMDTMMNAPLLFWAGEVTGEHKYIVAAKNQCNITERLLIREDGSSNHHYQFELMTYKPLYGKTFQGNRDDSTWTRGHSWGISGYPIAWEYGLRDDYVLPLHRDITYYMLNHLPEDLIPYWDFDFTSGDEPRDTSAGMICASGMLAAADCMPYSDEEKEILRCAANKMVSNTIDKYTTETGAEYDGLLTGVTPARKMPEYGLEICALYGDYFYLESLLRLYKPKWRRYW